MRIPSWLVVSFLSLAAFAAAPPARATVVSVPSLDEMAVASDVVAEVKVTGSRVLRDDQHRVVTLTDLDVLDGWKGAKKGDHLVLWQLGGNLDGRNAWIVGATHFHVGDHFVFFGVHHVTGPQNEVVAYGIGFGTFAVVPDPTGAKKDPVVVETVGDVVELKQGREQAPAVRRYDSLPAFKALVERALQGKDMPRPPVLHKLGPQPRRQ